MVSESESSALNMCFSHDLKSMSWIFGYSKGSKQKGLRKAHSKKIQTELNLNKEEISLF